ncbi:MAG: hypothetical protein AAGK14_03940 [Verrucomicrobiota bacterium]
MNTLSKSLSRLLAMWCLLAFAGFASASAAEESAPDTAIKAHYVEIVTESVDQQCRALEKIHGLSFGPKVPELGQARVAQTGDGTFIGVRAPLAEHEQPITRVYFEVEDIGQAVKKAQAAGAIIAYPPTKQGETGTWAIYILNGRQYGLWQE